MYKITSKERERFLKYVNKTEGCWNWVGYTPQRKKFYGQFTIKKYDNKGKLISYYSESTHRMSYLLFKGDIGKGLYVLHQCDNMLCVNPEHLFLGTAKQNSEDMVKKGRQSRGTGRHTNLLTEDEVRAIRIEYDNNQKRVTYRNKYVKILSSKYGVRPGTIYDIGSRRSWTWLK